MSELKLIEAAIAGDADRIGTLLDTGATVGQSDSYGWTALHWAAAKGHTGIVQKLLAAGADISHTGHDNRTAYQIALATAQVESAALLHQAQSDKGICVDDERRAYCKAYPIEALRKFPDWREIQAGLDADTVVYLHQDFSVTLSMWQGEDVVFDRRTPEWDAFCKHVLAFSVPTGLALASVFAADRAADLHRAAL
ncbi:MAG: ankyrin repeat domain-containing protein [Methylovulum sp.]|nr:ankyrin repeat domain-containing protein [Methylovulum sp.]